jgi:hypothetical protein
MRAASQLAIFALDLLIISTFEIAPSDPALGPKIVVRMNVSLMATTLWDLEGIGLKAAFSCPFGT